MRKIWVFSALIGIIVALSGCYKEQPSNNLKTKNVILVVMDGARYTETWGDDRHSNIPALANKIAPSGVVLTDFRNLGTTLTLPGQAGMLSGRNSTISNDGTESPEYPTIFQEWLDQSGNPSQFAQIISSKDKLSALASCQLLSWKLKKKPLTDCGIDGKGAGSGYREDEVTLEVAMDKLTNERPNLVLISFKQPDEIAHAADWPGYLQKIREVDDKIVQIWDFINSDPYYKGTTTLIITNDHGRHSGTNDGDFVNHGDQCEGCTHLMFFAAGPDFRSGYVSSVPRDQRDIAATVAYLLGFTMPYSEGQVMTELFQQGE
jgi:hypothetical protein